MQKHIFTVHSSLTFLMAYAVIKHKQLSAEEVIIISSKFKVPISDFPVYSSYNENYNVKWWHKISYINVPRNFDRFINKITQGSDFIAYIDLMSSYQKILITHPNCKHFHFIEEGNSAYMAFDDLNDLTWEDYLRGTSFRENIFRTRSFFNSISRVIRGYNLRLLQLPYHYMAYTNFTDTIFYCFSQNAFYNIPTHKRCKLTLQANDPVVKKLSFGVELRDEIIWIDGSNNRYTGLSEVHYHKAIEKALDLIEQKQYLYKGNKMYVKLRPGLDANADNYLVKAIKRRGYLLEVLPGNINLECLFIRSKDCKVIGVLTAALEYAIVFGHEVYSIYDLFEQRPPTFFDRMDGFWKNIKSLKG